MVITIYGVRGEQLGWVATVLMRYAPGSSKVCGKGDPEMLGE